LSGAAEGRRVSTRELVLARIEQNITDGKLHVGDRLPNERDFAQELGVSRSSLREVLRALEVMGVIVAGVGTGPTSGSIVQGDSSGALATLLRIHTALEEFSIDELVETRLMIERWAVDIASQKRTEDDLERLEELLTSMTNSDLSIRQYNHIDAQFHVLATSASGNRLLTSLMYALRDAIEREMVMRFNRVPDWRSTVDKLNIEHTEILMAIRSRQGVRASELVEAHIRGFYHDSNR
jgi:GntR family transcriptional regulator, transcriptional repressor for pyruvate dehydrogenase complex